MLIDLDKKELEVIVQQLWKSRKSEANVKGYTRRWKYI